MRKGASGSEGSTAQHLRATAPVGAGARIFPDRRGRRGSRRPPRPGCGPGSSRLPGHMDYMAAHGLKRARPGRAGARHAARDHRAHGLPAARRRRRLAGVEWQRLPTPGAGRGLDLRPRPRLSQGAAPAAAAPGRSAGGGGRAVRPPRVHRFGAGARGGAGRRAAASAGAASTRWRCPATPARCSSSARSTSTCRCRSPRRPTRTAAAARPASTSARRRPSWRRTGSMRGAASPT